MTDERTAARIELTGLRCEGRHGAYPGERDRARIFVVDIAVSADIAAVIGEGGSDGIIEVAALAATARRVVAGTSRALLERVADDIAGALLEEFARASEASVRVVKPDPDGLGADAEAVTVTRSRSVPRARRSPSARPGRPAARRGRG